jgi:hypothetical protein
MTSFADCAADLTRRADAVVRRADTPDMKGWKWNIQGLPGRYDKNKTFSSSKAAIAEARRLGKEMAYPKNPNGYEMDKASNARVVGYGPGFLGDMPGREMALHRQEIRVWFDANGNLKQ